MNVSQVLKLKGSATVETVAPTARVSEATAKLSQRRIGALVVCEGEAIVGILSERDIVRGIGGEGPGALEQPVSQLMTAKVMSCTPHDDVNTVLERMSSGRFRHMPVVERGRMVGLLSIGDVVNARIREIEAENVEMQTMLHG